MTTPPKSYVKPQPPSKDQLRAMLAQAVRNTQPELNPVPVSAPKLKVKGHGPTAKRPVNGRKHRA